MGPHVPYDGAGHKQGDEGPCKEPEMLFQDIVNFVGHPKKDGSTLPRCSHRCIPPAPLFRHACCSRSVSPPTSRPPSSTRSLMMISVLYFFWPVSLSSQ